MSASESAANSEERYVLLFLLQYANSIGTPSKIEGADFTRTKISTDQEVVDANDT